MENIDYLCIKILKEIFENQQYKCVQNFHLKFKNENLAISKARCTGTHGCGSENILLWLCHIFQAFKYHHSIKNRPI